MIELAARPAVQPRPRSCRTQLALLATLEHPGIPWADAVTSLEARDDRLIICYGED